MLIKELGSSIEPNFMHAKKAQFCIVVTELGIINDVKPTHPWKA